MIDFELVTHHTAAAIYRQLIMIASFVQREERVEESREEADTAVSARASKRSKSSKREREREEEEQEEEKKRENKAASGSGARVCPSVPRPGHAALTAAAWRAFAAFSFIERTVFFLTFSP